jgi:hypothetical protein
VCSGVAAAVCCTVATAACTGTAAGTGCACVATKIFSNALQVLTLFVEESGADFNQVADYLVAISATAADDVQVGIARFHCHVSMC